MSPLESVPVWSTTRPVRGGTATSAAAAKDQHASSARIQALAAFIAVLNPAPIAKFASIRGNL
jgi:hypothetical protein